jgi:hypothetical protein
MVVVLNHEHLILDDQRTVFFKDGKRLSRVAYDHPDDGMIDCVRDGQREDIDLCGSQRITDRSQRSGTIFEKQRKLSDDLHIIQVLCPTSHAKAQRRKAKDKQGI